MSKGACIECGERTPDGKYNHPDWPADNICKACHLPMWDDWIEQKIEEYLDEVGDEGLHITSLKDFVRS